MANSLKKALYWKEFILSHGHFPVLERLRAQFEAAEFVEFCECGCNSFKVRTRIDARPPPIASIGGYEAVFEADFRMLNEDKSVEIILFAGDSGNLEYVEIDCCANSYPMPDIVELMETPYHINASASLIR